MKLSTQPIPDYLDPDVAYLLGLVTARGTLHVQGDVRRLIIDFPHRLLTANAPPKSGLAFDIEKETRLALDDVRSRINELLEVNVTINRTPKNVQLVAVFTKKTMSWRNIEFLLKQKRSYKSFAIPDPIFAVPLDLQKEFVRGFADAAASPSNADRDWSGLQRIVLQVQHENWYLPVQLCRLLQVHIGVRVENILWGHPNLRGARNWAKEHRIRIYAENFAVVGFGFPYKQKILQSMMDWNGSQSKTVHEGCNPLIKIARKKPPRRDERHASLPACLRGKHFNAYFEICQALGCTQGTRPADATRD